MKRIVVVGASLAGLRAAETLRGQGFGGELTIVGEETHAPYDRPPLSKDFLLGKSETADLRLAGDTALDATWLLGRRARALRPGLVEVDGHDAVPADGVVITTGARARRLPTPRGLRGMHVLRTLDHAVALKKDLDQANNIVIVGAGFIGTEVASVAAGLGRTVTVVDTLERPFTGQLGNEPADLLRRTLADHGVVLRTGVAIAEIEGVERVSRVLLTDGTRLPADLVLTGIGAAPSCEWLAGSGVACEDGVLTDAWGRTTVPGIVAAGDVARFERGTSRVRVEHWTNARDMPVIAARTLLADAADADPGAPHTAPPYFWSEQFGHRIQLAGRIDPGLPVEFVEGAVEDGRFVAVQYRDGSITAVLGWSMPREFTHWRRRNDSSLRIAA